MNWVGSYQQRLFVVFRVQDNLSLIGTIGKKAEGLGNHGIEVDILDFLPVFAREQFPSFLDDVSRVVIGVPDVD